MTIPEDLQSFKESVTSSSLASMSANVTDLCDKLTLLEETSATAKNGFTTNYSSKNSEKVVTRFSKIVEIVSTVKENIASSVQPVIDKSNTLLEKIDRLEQLNGEISNAESTINYQNSLPASSRNTSLLNSAQSARSSGISEFNSVQSEANTLLGEIKSANASMDIETIFSDKSLFERPSSGNYYRPNSDSSKDESSTVTREPDVTDVDRNYTNNFVDSEQLEYLNNLQYGSFERKSYTASNGVTINFYLYIPDCGEDAGELPVHIYMHGSGEAGGSKTLTTGLPMLINNKTITPEGIVICIQADRMQDYYQASYQDAVIEFTNQLIEKGMADPDRISASGHSMGAIAGYKMVSRYPHYFSAFVPISGVCEVDPSTLTDTNIWAIHGQNDEVFSSRYATNAVNGIQNAGGNACATILSNKNHGIQTYTFTNAIQNGDGKSYDTLTWCLRQTREGEKNS